MSSYEYLENDDVTSNNSNELELVLDVYEDGTIQVVSSSDDRLSIDVPFPISNNAPLQREPSIERLFECAELKTQSTPPPTILNLDDISEDDDGHEVDRGLPELVELCPCRCEDCPRECYGERWRASGEETVMLEANMLFKVPMKRKHVERLLQFAKCYQDSIQ